MTAYELKARKELAAWRKKMSRKPSIVDKLSKAAQLKMNKWIPEKIHTALTAAIKQMVRAVLFGAKYTSAVRRQVTGLEETETVVRKRIDLYRKTAAAEGGITGAGGILLGLAEFPILLGIKMKMLFDIAALYGHDVKDYRERLFILYIFQLAFSSQQHRRKIFLEVDHWQQQLQALPENVESFDWRSFQQEYRDYIDLAKLFQLIPGIGALVGVVVNYRLINKLGETAINAYRLRRERLLLQH
ncbi:MAG: EcsC family protein [Chitinophagaceae bacterium]|jgi:hypothetical protein|nr:EcsC family protein [Chitinophagaceae bacterium]